MICFPLDNTEYEANALGAWYGTRTRGVFAADTHYRVTANGDMTVTLSPGIAWLKADTYWGVCLSEVNPTTLTIATADGSLTRYAAICLQLDKNLNISKAVVKYGPYETNPALSSIPPPEQASLDYDEIYVAAIRIRAGTTKILASDILDLRTNETYCGVMRDGVTGIPTQALYDNFILWLEGLKDILNENAAGNLYNMIKGLTAQDIKQTSIAIPGKENPSVEDALGSLMKPVVSGIKGDTESEYRAGEVNLTPENIGAEPEIIKLPVSKGGTNITSIAANRLFYALDDSTFAQVPQSAAAGNVLKQDPSGAPYWSEDAAAAALPQSGGTMSGNLFSNNPAVTTKAVRNMYAGTSDLTAGSSSLTTGLVYLVYE